MILTTNKKTALTGMLISIAIMLSYWKVLQNGFISYDDLKYIVENEHIRSGLSIDGLRWALTTTYDANWFPLTWLSHMADVSMFGSNPLGHHLVNMLMHSANALLLLWILARSTGYIWRSAAVASLFALHPMHVESVAWVAERKDVLSTLFFMLTVCAYLRYSAKPMARRYITVVVLYACGLAAKPMLVSLPLVLLLLDVWPLRRVSFGKAVRSATPPKPITALVREKIPLIILSAASCVMTFIIQRHGGAISDASPPFHVNAAHAMVNYAQYLFKTFWPADLAVLYPYVDELPVWQVVGAVVLLSLLTMLSILQWTRKPYWMVGWLWFLVTMAPVAGFVKFGVQSVADRYTYVPLIGVFIVMVWALADFVRQMRRGWVVMALLAIALFPSLIMKTRKQAGYWKDSVTLYEHALKVTRDNWVMHSNLAYELCKYGKMEQARWHLNEAIRIKPDYYIAHYNMGRVLIIFGDIQGAIQEFRTALKYNPSYVEAYYELCLASFQSGDMKTAIEAYEALKQINPNMANTLKNNAAF